MKEIAFVIGIVAIVLEGLIYISSKRERIHIVKMSACSVWAINHFLLGQLSGGILQFVAIARSGVFYYRGKKKFADSIIWLFVFIVATLISPILGWHGAVSLLPAFGSVFAVISFYSKPVYIIRGTAFIAILPWLIYHLLMNNITGAIGSALGLLSIVIGTTKDIIKKAKSKNQSSVTEVIEQNNQ